MTPRRAETGAAAERPSADPTAGRLVLGPGFLRLSLATSLLGVLCYAASEQRLGIAVLGLVVALLSMAMVSAVPVRRMPRLALNLLVVSAGLNTGMAVFTGSGFFGGGEGDQPLVSSLTDFLAVIVLIKMLDRGRPRDEAQLLALSVFVVIGAVLTSNSLLLGIALIAYVPLAIATSVLWQLYAGAFAQREAAERLRGGAPVGGVVHPALSRSPIRSTLAGLMVLSLAAAAGLFVAMPRTLSNQALGAFNLSGSGARTDFTPQITLGQSGVLSVSEEQVGEVVIRDGEGSPREMTNGPLYLRGAVLDEYVPGTGQWRRTAREEVGSSRSLFRPFQAEQFVSTVRPGVRYNPATGDFSDPATPVHGGLVQDITLRNAGPGRVILLSAWRPRGVVFESLTRLELERSTELLAQLDAPRPGRLAYRVVSVSDAGSDEPVGAGVGEAQPGAREAVAGPFSAGRIRDLAVRILDAEGLPGDLSGAEPGAVRKAAAAVERYLRLNFAYSLEMVAPDAGQDPIDMFLFRTRRGHCEYFAASMAALLRSAGIEARVVTGYVVAEFNPLTASYIIRRADAHAWVEARTRHGQAGQDRWETFDPTPPSALPPSIRAGLANWVSDLRQVWEAVELAWIERVVSFEQTTASRRVDLVAAGMAARQRVLALRRAIEGAANQVRAAVPGLGRGAALTVLALLAGGVLVGAWTLGRSAWTWLRPKLGGGARAGPTPRFYRRLLAVLEQAGAPMPAGRAPVRHVRGAALAGFPPGAADLAAAVAERYYAVRFGGRALTRDEELAAERMVNELAGLLERDAPRMRERRAARG